MKTNRNSHKRLSRVVFIMVISILYMLMFSVYAFAYIDPSALTYLIQVVAGLAIGGMTVLSVYWEKIKKSLKEALKIDLESKKEVESDDIHVRY